MQKRVELGLLSDPGRGANGSGSGGVCLSKGAHVWLTDEAEAAVRLRKEGECVVFLLTEENRKDSVPGIRYCLEWSAEMEAADGMPGKSEIPGESGRAGTASKNGDRLPADFLEKVWRRHTGLPWHILDTPRLSLREMTEADMDALYALHEDAQAARFLDPLEKEPEAQHVKMQEYMENMYGFYEYGMWMVTLRSQPADGADRQQESASPQPENVFVQRESALRQPETIIGQAGLQIREGFDTPELGFVIAPAYRGKGYAYEACRAVLEYGFEELELPSIRVVVDGENERSLRLCEKLGFAVDNTAGSGTALWTGAINAADFRRSFRQGQAGAGGVKAPEAPGLPGRGDI